MKTFGNIFLSMLIVSTRLRILANFHLVFKLSFSYPPPRRLNSKNRSQSEIRQIDQRKVDLTFYRSKILSSEFRPPEKLGRSLKKLYFIHVNFQVIEYGYIQKFILKLQKAFYTFLHQQLLSKWEFQFPKSLLSEEYISCVLHFTFFLLSKNFNFLIKK